MLKLRQNNESIDDLYEDPVDVEIEGIGKISIRRPTLKGQQLNLKALPSNPEIGNLLQEDMPLL